MIPIIDAIVALDPNTQVSVVDEDMKQILWHDGNPNNITSSQIKTKQTELQAEYDAQAYARNRKKEYDALNQFELISDDTKNGTTTHIDAIEEIKVKWPKDNSGPV